MMRPRLGRISLVSAIAMAAWTANLVAQERPLPPSAAPRVPRGRASVPKPPDLPAASPSIDVLLRRAGLSRAQVERRKAATPASAALPPSRPESAEPQAARERSARASEPPAAAPASPTIRELLEIVRRQPGGPAVLERARRGGARIVPSESSSGDGSSATVRTQGGPRLAEATFDGFFPNAAQATVAKVTRDAPNVNVAGLGSLYAEAYYPYRATSTLTLWGPLDRWSSTSSSNEVGGSFSVKSYLRINLNVQTTGWYLINVQATSTGAEMRHASSSVSFTLVQSFTKPTASGYSSYPVVLNLTAGWHYFGWANLNWFPYVSEVSVTKL